MQNLGPQGDRVELSSVVQALIFCILLFHVLRTHSDSKMINVAGVVSIVLFYVLILAVGIWAGRKRESGNDSEEEVMLAGRSIGLFVGIFTMTG